MSKCIFQETSEPIRSNTGKVYDREDERIYTFSVDARIETVAHYDAKLGVLVVDQKLHLSSEYRRSQLLWFLPDRRILESIPSQAAAIRRAVALADDYLDVLSKTVFDDARSDDEVIEASRKAHEAELAY
jgi:hypothetical protein